jgi:hypothetical protein
MQQFWKACSASVQVRVYHPEHVKSHREVKPAMDTMSRARRGFLHALAGLAAASAVPALRAQTIPLIANAEGGYRFLPGNPVFAGGAVAEPGFGFVHAVFSSWLPFDAGLHAVERHLRAAARPIRALAGLELRLPRQLTAEEFAAFNAPYVERLMRWGMPVDGLNPVSRTNVAPADEAPAEPSVHAFSYCIPVEGFPRSYVMSGMTEGGASIVAHGDTSAAGMRRKLAHVAGVVSRRLEQLGVGWQDASHIDLYSAHDFGAPPAQLLEPLLGTALRRGLRWHHGRPPVVGLELELEARGLARELVVPV